MPPAPATLYPRAAEARALLARQEARLVEAIAVLRRDRLAFCETNLARNLLSKVRHWQRDHDAVVDLALGFAGENGWGPLIDLVCRQAEARQNRRAA